jgi:N-acetylglutamate synthase-like GNAT family acetyltransferase
MEIRIIRPGSSDYEQMIALRVKTLLEPIGVPAGYIEPAKEAEDIFIGAFKHEIIGCCVLTKKDENTIQLRQMAVRNDQQGKGIGASIVQFAEVISKKLGYSTIIMHARDPVIEFYKKCGYSIAGEQFFEVGIGHHRMEKTI